VAAPDIQAAQQPITYFPGTLVDAAEISRPELADHLRVLDVRPWEKYMQRHVPGAVSVNVDDWIKAFTVGHPVLEWEKRIGELGIDLETTVVLCDDGSGKDAASLWSILRYWGIRDVRVLNGGWPAWLFAGAPQDDTETIAAPRSVKLERNAARVISRDELVELLKTSDEQIVEALSPEESSGGRRTRSGERDLGKLRRLGWVEVIDWRNSTFIGAADLKLLFRSADIDPDRPILVYGDSLEQAAMLSFTLEAVGAKKVSISFRGWDQ
jgi:thiosulfate/3-mercaptopyruvate sulfurtransferase